MSALGDIPIDPVLKAPLYWQLYTHLRSAILSGRLKKGVKLPSSRALAGELNISRNTVISAYEQLLAEGYLEGREASGTFVAMALPEAPLAAGGRASAKRGRASAPAKPRLSTTGEALLTLPGGAGPAPLTLAESAGQPFTAGVPGLDIFPRKLWARLVSRQVRALTGRMLNYQDPAGYRPLREAIAQHVTVSRRVHCTPDQIVVVAGSQGGLDLAARLLLNPGDEAWLEDPGYLGARGALTAAGARIVPVPVDEQGLAVAEGLARAPEARLAYLTPSHQFPLGMTMSLTRRLAILDWARRAGAYLIEDDYDSEYRYAGRPLAALQGLDEDGCVIYCGTFSKVLFPALRAGYLILPPRLVEAFLAARRFVDSHTPLLEQAALAEFISAGHFSRHLRRMRAAYAERRAVLLHALADVPLELHASETGLHCIGWLPDGADDRAVSRAAAAQGVDVTPLSRFSLGRQARPGLLLGFACADPRRLREGARHLAGVLEKLAPLNRH